MSIDWERARDRLFRLWRQPCFVCGQDGCAGLLCGACQAALPHIAPADACPRCAQPGTGGLACAECLRAPRAFDAAMAAYVYAFPVAQMIHALKYRADFALPAFLAQALADLPPPEGGELLLPMPLHPRRLAERGFNQALALSRPLARRWGLALAPGLARRVRDTTAQASLARRERLTNLRGAFAVDARVAGRSVVVIDDVLTTGTSLGELAQTLKRAGARRVIVRVVARTQGIAEG